MADSVPGHRRADGAAVPLGPGLAPEPDGRYILVDGRRWRAADPSIPTAFRRELVAELMQARRDVGAATRTSDEGAETAARRRVNDARVALGERGEPWWEAPTPTGQRARVMSAAMALLRARRAESSICPSDVARVVGGPHWRSLVPIVRDAAAALAATGIVEVTQGGEPVAVTSASGPVRIRRGPRFA